MNLRTLTATVAVAGAFASVGSMAAAQEAPGLLVTAAWVAEHAHDDGLVLLHVSSDSAYQVEHIAGAHHVDFMRIWHQDSHGGGLVLELPEPDRFQAMLRSWGISDDSRIVVYWGEEWVTPLARTVFTLDWAGLGEQTVVMNGGLEAWKHAGFTVTGNATPPGRGTVVVRPRADLVVDAAWVQQHAVSDGFSLVDARARVVYDGVREDRGKAGHIPGAGSTPWGAFIDENVMVRGPAELRAVFGSAGVREGDTVVAYCHIGQYATMALLAARILGHEVKLYDGAFQDWANRDLPVER